MPPEPLGNRTKIESTAALLPKQGSRAMGFGTDCGKKKNPRRKTVLHITSQANTSDYRSFAVTALVCVSNMLSENLNILFSAETPTLICSHKLSSPKQNPPSWTILWQFYMRAAGAANGYQTEVLGGEICAGGANRPSSTPDSLMPISAVYQHLIHMWRWVFSL